MSADQLQKAKSLIQQKRYAEARNLLKKINNPTAKRWLAKLDEIDSPRKNMSPLVYILGLLVTLIIGIGIGVLLLNRQTALNTNPINNAVASIPTLMIVPSETSTPVPTDTFTPEPTSTFTATPLPTSTFTPQPTDTLVPTDTPPPTITPTLTSSSTITVTPFRTRTPLPTVTLIPPSPIPAQQARLGPIYDSLYDETYNIEITLDWTEFPISAGFMHPSSGNVYVLSQLEVKNLGPGTLRNISQFNFQLKDGNGAVRNSTYISRDCNFPLVDLPAGGSVTGCVAFEAPATGSLEVIYAPFQYDGLKPGRYISFRVRQF
jgi:hypothetical protein